MYEESAKSGFQWLREHSSLADTGVTVYERDRHAAGSLLGSALALRLFLFFVPMVLLVLGLLGLLGRFSNIDSAATHVGVTGEIADHLDETLDQGAVRPWLIAGTGLIGVATTGRSLTRALVVSSALAWQLGGKQKTGVRVIGTVVGLVVGLALLSVILNRIRLAAGVAVASMSFVGALAVYVVLWSLLFLALPRGTTDPGAALPGAALVATVLAGMQAISMFYLPGQIDRASAIYGAVGVATTTLGWFFILGRTIAFSFALNAVLFERWGSASKVVFAIPGIRAIPRRYAPVARYFDLQHQGSERGDT